MAFLELRIMSFTPPDRFNIADYFLDDRIREGLGARIAIRTANETQDYDAVAARSNQFANVLADLGVGPGSRVIVALPDVPDFPAALFGILKTGGQVVMVNSQLRPEQILQFYEYVEPDVVIVHKDQALAFGQAQGGPDKESSFIVVGQGVDDRALSEASTEFDTVPTRHDDPALWLFSGGTTGQPKGVVQSHSSFANTTECYAKAVLRMNRDDVTLSVPKLYFGYATGTNLLFPFAVGASTVLFPERCTADELFAQIARHRPSILVNVPTMVNHMVSHPSAESQDLSCLRLATSAGEALPPELHQRWNDVFGAELLDGLGTAEMWHVFISNRPGQARPGTLGTPVPGFEVRLCDETGVEVPRGEVGRMRVRGASRAIEYWRHPDLSREALVDDWYISADMMTQSEDGFITYQGRADDLLKVSGKWLSPSEVENCLLEHEIVKEAAVVGVETAEGLFKPEAFVVLAEPRADAAVDLQDLEGRLQAHVKARLEPYKYPRAVHVLDALPRTHLGKVDRGRLKRGGAS